MFRNFSGESADDLWLQVANCFKAGNCPISQNSRSGTMKELLHVTLSISNPRQRWVASRNPPLNLAFALAEVLWIFAGRNDSSFLNYFNKQLPHFAGVGPTYHGAYGYRLRQHFGLDQIETCFRALSAKPTSRQIVLQMWDAKADMPDEFGSERSADIPCNIMAMLKIRDGKLEWTQIMRSNDIFRGLPYNIVQFTALQEIIAGWLGLQIGSYNHLSDSLHVYEKDLECIGDSIEVEVSPNTDSLSFSKIDFDVAFAILIAQANRIVDPATDAKQLQKSVRDVQLPAPLRNILVILAAEGARRRGSVDVMWQIIPECSNVCYRELYFRWLKRLGHSIPVITSARGGESPATE
jgi:thymidylate synthase